MSRIGRTPIAVPDGVDVRMSDRHITVTGPLGTLERDLPPDIEVRREDGEGAAGEGTAAVLRVERPDDQRDHRALHGLTRSLVDNMVTGVTKGFQ